MATSADVPNKYDLVLNSKGYMVADELDVKAVYGYTPTFVERSNAQGSYGDNFQDFWLSVSQKDWSLGEGQRYFRDEDDPRRRYWSGTNIDVHVPGQAKLRSGSVSTATTGVTAITGGTHATDATEPTGPTIVFGTTSTNLEKLDRNANFTDLGAHGAGAEPTTLISDGTKLYMSSTAAGSVGVRKYTISPAAFATFSATPADQIEFLNNTLYGLRFTNGDLIRYDTAGTATSIFTWKQADGTAQAGMRGKLKAFGTKLAILLTDAPKGTELWIYDGGAAPTLAASFPSDFYGANIDVLENVLFVGGSHVIAVAVSPGRALFEPAVYYYTNGAIGLLWRSDTKLTTSNTKSRKVLPHPPLAPFSAGMVFIDVGKSGGQFQYYNMATGGVHSIGTSSVTEDTTSIAMTACQSFFLLTKPSVGLVAFTTNAPTATSGTLITSLFDFDSSLTKLFRGIKVDFDSPGGTETLDIAYRVGDTDGSYTTLQTAAVSGTEYTLTGVTGRSISVKITLNGDVASSGTPTIKRITVRAAPSQTTFRRGTVFIRCTGRDGDQPLRLRDNSLEIRDGLQIATDLRTAATLGTPFSLTDEFGTVSNAVIENDNFEIRRVRPNEFLAVVSWREV